MEEFEEKRVKNEEAVDLLPRTPGKCPVTKCDATVFPSNVMMHMMDKHSYADGTINSEIYDHKPVAFHFDPSRLEYGENRCVATLAYGGSIDQPETQPGCDFMSLPNAALINYQHSYDNFLPIMMMVCRSNCFALLENRKLQQELSSLRGHKAGTYVIWLVAPKTTRKLYYTLTIHDRYYHISRSVIRSVRDFCASQNPSEFMVDDDNYLLLRDSEILQLMSKPSTKTKGKQKRGIPVELIVYQYPRDPDSQWQKSDQGKKLLIKMPHTKAQIQRTINGKLSLTKRPLSKTVL
ncbi:uncharacterized protein LOC117566451 [Drosophila albomicans]|uniref:Uncharacterized protein LOC117566451 n=1 Tax=Drosophila albomicans TaxID=7291 RepID=A0A6P8WRC4_DROAB|nr:uncharacterized protein LOC117566451 [Drosophila albomicans]